MATTGIIHFSQYWGSCSRTFFSPRLCLPSVVSADHSKLGSRLTIWLLITSLLSRLEIEKASEFHKDHHLFIAFINLKAAFHSVERLAFWSILKNTAVPDKLVNLLSRPYDGAECYARANAIDSSWFSFNSGVRQGGVVVPHLFNCGTDHLMALICQQTTGVWFGNYYLTDLSMQMTWKLGLMSSKKRPKLAGRKLS